MKERERESDSRVESSAKIIVTRNERTGRLFTLNDSDLLFVVLFPAVPQHVVVVHLFAPWAAIKNVRTALKRV